MSLADSADVILVLQGPAGLEVAPSSPITRSPGWELRSTELPDMKFRGTRRHWQQSWRVTPRQPGSTPLQVEPIRYRESNQSEWQTFAWKAFPITVTTSVTRADIAEMRPSAGPEFLPEEPSNLWRWLSGILAGSVALGLAVYLRRRVQRPAVSAPSAVSLREELARLEAEAVIDAGQAGRLADALSHLVRGWLEQTQGLPCRWRTTPECLEALHQTGSLSAGRMGLLTEVLERCDLTRFARLPFSTDEWRQLVNRTRELLYPEERKQG